MPRLSARSGTRKFTLVVREWNPAPVFTPVLAETVEELTSWTWTLEATDGDLPAQGLSYALVSGPVGLTVSPLGEMEWTPTEVQGPSTNVVVVQVFDDGVPPQSSTNEFVLVIQEVNLPPALAEVPDVAVGVGELDGVDCWDGPTVGLGDEVPTVGEGGSVPPGVGPSRSR